MNFEFRFEPLTLGNVVARVYIDVFEGDTVAFTVSDINILQAVGDTLLVWLPKALESSGKELGDRILVAFADWQVLAGQV